MRALVFDEYGGPLEVREVPRPSPADDGVVVQVRATGICRSDWHGWQGHDPGIALPHVPGHELAGVIDEVGSAVTRWKPGDRVTVPFVNACGRCPQCLDGDHQVCENQRQPGFSHWGSFAEYVALDVADVNLVAVPEDMSFVTAASLGCRFATSYRAVISQGRVAAGEWVVVHGCGGVGLSAIQAAVSVGASVIAVDVSEGALELATSMGAAHALVPPAVPEIRRLTDGGAHVSIDALGSEETCLASIASLRPRGRHVQIGLLPGPKFPVPMARLLFKELELIGSHGMAAHHYPEMLAAVSSGALSPQSLVTRELGLEEAGEALASVGARPGIAVITF
jgi:D-arabinose 1-dehydrogenase-like Zn-dependent alcohol dehydrogenase